MKNQNANLIVNTKKLVITSMFTALTTVATIAVQIPMAFGYVNLGDMFVLLSAFVLGTWYGVAAAGIGSAMADVIIGYAIYAPGTFIIKAIMSLIVSLIIKSLNGKIRLTILLQLIAGIVAEIIMVLGYFFYEAVILGYSWAAVSSVVGNLIQGGVGVALAITVFSVFNNRKIFFTTNSDAKKEKENE